LASEGDGDGISAELHNNQTVNSGVLEVTLGVPA